MNEAPCGKPQGISIKKIVSLVIAMTIQHCGNPVARRLSDNYGWSKFDLSECPRINDRQPGRGFATPKNADFCIYRTASLPQGFRVVITMTIRKCHCEE